MRATNGGFLISQVKQVQGRVFDAMLQEAGIEEFNGAQGRILYILWQEDNLPIVELSRRTGLAKTTLTGMLDRMEEKGILERRFDKKDRRQVRIVLSDKAMNERFYRGFTDSEIKQFEETLERILRNLTQE